MTPFQITRSVRNLNRLRQIATVLTRYGFGHVVAQINLTRFVPVWMLRNKPRRGAVDEGPTAIGRRLAEVCEELGPTFIKLGQILSTRPDIVPVEVANQLSRLQDDVPPFDSTAAKAIIAESLGRPINACFANMEDAPIASASIGQVYRAALTDGHQSS